MIFVRKQLSSAAGQHRRVGIIGTVALVQRLGAATSDALEGQSAIGGLRGWCLCAGRVEQGPGIPAFWALCCMHCAWLAFMCISCCTALNGCPQAPPVVPQASGTARPWAP